MPSPLPLPPVTIEGVDPPLTSCSTEENSLCTLPGQLLILPKNKSMRDLTRLLICHRVVWVGQGCTIFIPHCLWQV